eukprot:3906854-Alexandrium_andersonii.AAC.1
MAKDKPRPLAQRLIEVLSEPPPLYMAAQGAARRRSKSRRRSALAHSIAPLSRAALRGAK